MEPSKASSNWKELQKKLQLQKVIDGASNKRKRTVNDEAAGARVTKKHKGRLQQEPKRTGKRASVRKKMTSLDHATKARSQSLPPKQRSTQSQTNGALKSAASHADLKATEAEDTINEGNSSSNVAGKFVAIDCEMVGIGPAPHTNSQLARVSLVNIHGAQIYDSFVLPQSPVTDYRTSVSGITAALLAEGRPFEEVQQDIDTLLRGRILVGHAVKNDLAVLQLSHPRSMIRDTSHHKPWKEQYCNGGIPSLRILAKAILGWESFQEGKHNSVEDSRAAMMLFTSEKSAFEAEARRRFGPAASGSQPNLKVSGQDTRHPGTDQEGRTSAKRSAKKKKTTKKKKG